MKGFLTALQFLTVFRIKKDLAVTREGLSGSVAYFPLVGLLQGAVLLVLWRVLSEVLPWGVVSGLLLLALIITYGGLHLDGFADTVDGLAGGATPEERLRIMKDSSTGAVGAGLLAVVLLLKYLAIKDVPLEARAGAILTFPAAGRWAMAEMSFLAGYARREGGLGEAFAGNRTGAFLGATFFAALAIGLALGVYYLLLLPLLGVFVYLWTLFFNRKLGGVTGDVFGFQCETGELFFLLTLIALARF